MNAAWCRPPWTGRARAALWLVAAGVAALTSVGAAATPAFAHAMLLSTSPADGARLDDGPDEVVLQFNEPIAATLGAVRVFDRDGERVDAGDAEVAGADGSQLAVGVDGDLADGDYVVTWNAISADDHPVRGAFVWTVGVGGGDGGDALSAILAATSGGAAAIGVGATALRVTGYGAALVAAGAVAFLLYVHDRAEAERRVLARVAGSVALVGAAASVLGIGFQAALASGLGPSAMVDPRTVGAVLGSSFGTSALLRAGGLVAIALALRFLWRPAAVGGAVLGAAATLASFAVSGHTVTTDPRWLVVTANVSHTAAGATWFGGLVLLTVCMRRRRLADDPVGGGRLVARFSTMATAAVLLVSVAGMGLAWAEVRALRALTSTTYGWTLVGKLVLVGLILVAAAYNHNRLVPAIRRGGVDAWGRLRRVVRVEVFGLVAVVAVSAVLSNVTPARSEAGVTGAFSTYVDMGDGYQASVTVDPNRAGVNELHLYLLGETGAPVDIPGDLELTFAMPSNDIAPIARTPFVAGPGHWSYTGPEMSIPGEWQVGLRARVSEFAIVEESVDVPVGG